MRVDPRPHLDHAGPDHHLHELQLRALSVCPSTYAELEPAGWGRLEWYPTNGWPRSWKARLTERISLMSVAPTKAKSAIAMSQTGFERSSRPTGSPPSTGSLERFRSRV